MWSANQLTALVPVVTTAGGLGVGSVHKGATRVESGGTQNNVHKDRYKQQLPVIGSPISVSANYSCSNTSGYAY